MCSLSTPVQTETPKMTAASDLPEKPQENPKKSPTKKIHVLSTFSDYFYEFSNNTTVHGFKYIVESGRYSVERLWWLVMMCVCVYVCGTLILKTLQKWETNPVFIGFSQTPMSLWHVPFPAVTVCPSNKIRKSKYDYVARSLKFKKKTLPAEDYKAFADMTRFCGIGIYNLSSHSMDMDSIRLFLDSAPKYMDTVTWCNWNKELCFKNFAAILTDYGVCFTFNALDESELYTNLTYVPPDNARQPNISRWTIDDNYEKTKETVYPLRATSTSDKLFFTLRSPAVELNRPCGDRSFKVFLHHPAETPTLSTQSIILAQDEGYSIKITPDVTITSSQLLDYEPLKRGCYFSTERKLMFYKIYTEQGCRVECMANHTLQQCGCVSYFMPHDGKTKICGLSDSECESSVGKKLLSLDLDAEISGRDEERRRLSCNCLPLCTSIRYNADITQSHAYDINVEVAFKDTKFTVMERNELFSDADFWASCGGLLGLFVGFSVLSFAEIVYFLTLRWICNVWSLRKLCWFW